MTNLKNLLVLAPHYLAFIKDQVEALSLYVGKIEVLITYNPLSEVSNFLPFGRKLKYFQKYTKKNIVDFRDVPNNVNISLIPTMYLVPDGSNKAIGDKVFKNMVQWIEDKKIKIDFIHAHFTWPCGYAGVKLAKKYDVPIVVTAHGFDAYELPFRDPLWFDRISYVLNNANHVITVSKKNMNIIVEKIGISDNNISVISNGFDPKLFCRMDMIRLRQNLSLPLNKKIVLNVANLVPVKGHCNLIKAISEIVGRRRNDVLCIIVGDGILRTDLEKQIKSLKVEDYIKLVGAKPHNEIPLWINSCDLFVMPSLNEGNPTVMFEALGCGKPFLGTKVGGIPEIIVNDMLGTLVEPNQREGMAQTILDALDVKWDVEYIQKYAKKFTWDCVAKDIVNIYETCMKRIPINLP